MSNPLDIIADNLRATGRYGSEAVEVAGDVANALTDAAIVTYAGQALRDDSRWANDLPSVVQTLSADDRRAIARVVLRSVGGAP